MVEELPQAFMPCLLLFGALKIPLNISILDFEGYKILPQGCYLKVRLGLKS